MLVKMVHYRITGNFCGNLISADMLILDFSKAFDTVPHKRLLKKLEPYGINGNILSCLEAWLTQREQQVTIEGDKSVISAAI
jgi:methylaspartate ammonia-lyase